MAGRTIWKKSLAGWVLAFVWRTIDDLPDAVIGDAVTGGYCSVGHGWAKRPHLRTLPIGEFGIVMMPASTMASAATLVHVTRIVRARARDQMARIDASRIVAGMTKHWSVRETPVVEEPAGAMGPSKGAIAAEPTMAEVECGALPRPAFFGAALVNKAPETCYSPCIHGSGPSVGRGSRRFSCGGPSFTRRVA